MKKIMNRSLSVLLIAAMVIVGMSVYILRYIDDGKKWATYFGRANSGAYGVMLDRNEIPLAYFDATNTMYSTDGLTRISNYHVTGDYWGRTGTGLITRFWKESQNFSLLTGTTRVQNSVMRLNIDARLNNRIFEALGADREAAVLLCNWKTGELLGMVSTPTIDPILPNENPKDGTYINRCISAAFIPGSTFKLVTAAAALENMPNIDSRQFYCEGVNEVAGVEITDVAPHYTQTFEKALANSCNVAFSQIGIDLGQNTMVKYVKQLGFLDSHSLDGISTAKGSYPTDFVGDPEIGWSAIGQSVDLVCPYSMLRYVCAIANGGVCIEPKIINDGKPGEETRLIKASTAQRLTEMMNFTVVDHYYADSMFPGLGSTLCAKTGTAELGDGTSNSWFVGFLADEEHPFAFVTLVEHGGYGITTAGTITNEFLQWAVENIEQ